MTKREAAIVFAYTGICIGDIADMQAYVEEKAGQAVMTHELARAIKRYRSSILEDFQSIKVT